MSTFRRALRFVLFVVAGLPTIATAQDLPALARAHASRHPGEPLTLAAPPSDYVPKSAEELAKESALVVEARLVRVKSYLGGSNDRVLTDYSVVQPNVIVGTLPARSSPHPGLPTPQLVVTVYGGEIVLDGVTVRATNTGRERIDERATYLLFLMKCRQGATACYEIYDGGIFEVRDWQIRSLLKHRDVFDWSVGMSRSEVLARIRAAVSR